MSQFIPISEFMKHRLFTHLYEQLDDAIFILDAHMRYLSTNAAYEIMIGYHKDFLVGRSIGVYAENFLSKDELDVLKDIANHLDDNGMFETNFALKNRYQQVLNCYITFERITIDDVIFYVGMVRDESSIIEDKKQVVHLLNYNQLTGIPNRKVFLNRITELLANNAEQLAVIRLNIDRYRNLVSTLGQEHVDELIKVFVKRVKDFDFNDLLCFSHFGGDDFGLLFRYENLETVHHYLNVLMRMAEQPYVSKNVLSEETTVYFRLSAGISYSPDHGDHITHLMNKAEKALHQVKHNGGDDACWYTNELEASVSSLTLESELRYAIKNNQFEPYYQPKVILHNNAIVGFEALVRWHHPTRGLLKPASFMDAIVKYKLSFELFSLISQKIAQQLAQWQTLGLTQHICINADAAEFNHPHFTTSISQLLNQHLFTPCRLHIEVTESSLMLRNARVRQQLIDIKKLGVQLALDDFGTGYASLSYLQKYPFDFIKIDKSFISNITVDQTQKAIVKAILDLASALNMDTIAEGIETRQQQQILEHMGCTYGQGYWFGYPVKAEVATHMLIEKLDAK